MIDFYGSYVTKRYVSPEEKAMIKAKAIKFKPKEAEEFRAIFTKAYEAGMAAGKGANPTPMHVVERVNPLDDTSPVKRDYGVVSDGVCGFASIEIKGAASRFAKWLMANTSVRKNSGPGVRYWVGEFNQSYERKCAFAVAFARVLNENGYDAYVSSRLD